MISHYRGQIGFEVASVRSACVPGVPGVSGVPGVQCKWPTAAAGTLG